MQDRKKLNQWLRKTLFNSRDGERCRKLVIRHITSAGKVGTEVASFDIEAKSLTEDSYLDTVTSEVESAFTLQIFPSVAATIPASSGE